MRKRIRIIREGCRRRLRDRRGFTLVEMLIVVAIIAVLIAVSIPMVSGALDRARHAADSANERAAKAAMNIYWMMRNVEKDVAGVTGSTGYYDPDKKIFYYVYDAEKGKLVFPPKGTAGEPVSAYGKCQKHEHTSSPNGTAIYIRYHIDTHLFEMCWVDVKTSISGGSSIPWDSPNTCRNQSMD